MKAKTIRSRITVILMAFSMVFTGLGISQWGMETAWADDSEITVTVKFDATVVADDLSQLKKDLTDSGVIEDSITQVPEPITVTVPKGSTVQQVLQAAKTKQDFTIKGLDTGFVTQIGFISSENLANLVNCSVGAYTSGNVFASAGWSFYVNGTPLSNGIGVDKVSEDKAIVLGSYNLYGTWSSAESKMVYYDEPLINNYYGLKALIDKPVDLSAYTQEETDAYNGAKKEAKQLVDDMYSEAKLTGDAATTLKEAKPDFHTDGGMWIGYIEAKQSAIWGPGSITEKLDKAKTKLQKAIDRELVVKEGERSDLTSLSFAKYSDDQVMELTPGFDAATQNYSVNQLPNSETGFQVKATSKAEGATITLYVNGAKKNTIKSGASNWSMYYNSLSTGDNKVEVVVTPPNGDVAKNKTYTVVIPRAKSSESLLKGIAMTSGNYKTFQYSYKNKTDGTLFRVGEDGSETETTGFNVSTFSYNAYVSNSIDSIKLSLTAKDSNAGITLKDESDRQVAYKSGTYGTPVALREGNNKYNITVNSEDGSTSQVYKLNVIRVKDTPELVGIDGTGLKVDSFDGLSSLNLYYQNGEASRTARVKTSENAYVYLGSLSKDKLLADNEFTIDDSKFNSYGIQSITLYVSRSSEGKASEPYAKYTLNVNKMFSIEGSADEVISYICPASQYTNRADYGLFINKTLTGAFKTGYWGACTSLGNFGGEVVYKFNTPIVNSEKHPYGIDFIVYGNSNGGKSFAEPGNVYVSKDGNKWYSLAGSEHFEDSTVTDYKLTYYSDKNGVNSKYTDNQGEDTPISVSAGNRQFPDSGLYPKFKGITDKLSVEGILIQKGGSGVTKECAYGYADMHKNGNNIGTAVNPYVANHYTAVEGGDGMDLDWAVDEKGQPVELDRIQYVKVQTATLIDGGAIGEKSTEISGIFATQESKDAVGKTDGLTGVKVGDGSDDLTVNFSAGKSVYDVNAGGKKYLSITPIGGNKDDNIYINNQRLTYSDGFSTAKGFTVTRSNPKTVRVLVQNGEKEPKLYTLNITGTGEESSTIIEGIAFDCKGVERLASKNSDGTYGLTVGNLIDSGKIIIRTNPANTVKINGDSVKESYNLEVGDNTFKVDVSDGKSSEQVQFKVVRQSSVSPGSSKINVKFTLYGDTHHNEDQVHSYADRNKMPCWIPEKTFEVNNGATVKDVIEMAMAEAKISYVNKGGNYISQVNGLGEKDNGPKSGWMYSINGTEPPLGIGEQVVKSGDVIVLYYTDDYTQTPSGQQFDPAGDAGKKASETCLNIAGADKNGEIKLNVSKDYLADMASKAESNLKITSPLGNIILTPKVMSSITAQAKGKEVSFVFKSVAGDEYQWSRELGDDTILLDVKIKDGDSTIDFFGGNKVTVEVPVSQSLTAKELAGARPADGKLMNIGGKAVSYDGKPYFAVETDTLSTCVVGEKTTIDRVIGEQTVAETKNRIKAGVKATTITITGIKVRKGSMTVTWKKSKGYKVDGYQVYRSASKTKGFKKFMTTVNRRYKNTKSIKKGVKYYYKVRGYRYIDGIKVYTKWSKVVGKTAKW